MRAPKVFISYSWLDNQMAGSDRGGDVDKIRLALNNAIGQRFGDSNFRCFIDYEYVENDAIPERVRQMISESDYFIIFLSQSYVERPNPTSEYYFIRARTSELTAKESHLSLEMSDGTTSLTKYPRIFVIYLGDVDEMQSARPATELVRGLQSYYYFDFREDKERAPDDPVFRARISSIAKIIKNRARTDWQPNDAGGAEARELLATLPRFDTIVDKERNAQLLRLKALMDEEADTPRFRGALIDELIGDLESEIIKVNSNHYDHDISLSRSFLLRATPIFRTAEAVFAVSVDKYSSFWTESSVYDATKRYIEIQKDQTYRLFVFSNAHSMAENRNILKAHFDRYGQRSGRILYTNLNTWEKYLTHLSSLDASNHLPLDDESDFAILKYDGFAGPVHHCEAVLKNGSISFRPIHLSPAHEAFITDLSAQRRTDNSVPLGRGSARIWQESFSQDDISWFNEIARLFPSEDLKILPRPEQGRPEMEIMHIVLFSREISIGQFSSSIRNIIPDLMTIRGRDGSALVKSLWYGTDEAEAAGLRDPWHGNFIRIANDVIRQWPHCLIVRFDSINKRNEYYEHPVHSDARRKLYLSFRDVEITKVIQNITQTERAEERHSLGLALEVLASRYMHRLDYISQSPIPYLSLIPTIDM